ncbi:hypothetical protein ABZ540_31375 [Nocardia xishanensis]|uniref:hypothetical protein n=1 Tax=Nocardia xishanensis TaxID=238964 RepID=UPI0033C9BB4A
MISSPNTGHNVYLWTIRMTLVWLHRSGGDSDDFAQNGIRKMHVRTITAAALLTVGAIAGSGGIVHAEPAPAPAGVSYTATQVGKSAVVTVDAGSLVVADNQLQVRAADGTILAGMPLAFHLDDKLLPIEATVDGRTATLTPITDPSRATAAAPIARVEEVAARTREERDVAAFTKMDGQIRFAVMVGAIIGGVVAGGLGCLVGGVVAAPSAVLTAIFGPLAGCVAGALVMAPVGALGGTLFIAAPVAVAAAVQYFTTINAPMPPAAPEDR